MLHRWVTRLLLVAMLALGMGATARLHDLQHERDDATANLAAKEQGRAPQDAPVHDETNCPIHAQLHMPLLAGGGVMPLLLLLLLAILSPACRDSLIPRLFIGVPVCRGPPVR